MQIYVGSCMTHDIRPTAALVSPGRFFERPEVQGFMVQVR